MQNAIQKYATPAFSLIDDPKNKIYGSKRVSLPVPISLEVPICFQKYLRTM